MEQDFSKNGKMFRMLNDWWGIVKKHYFLPKTDEQWEEMLNEFDGFYLKYKDVSLAHDLALCVI